MNLSISRMIKETSLTAWCVAIVVAVFASGLARVFPERFPVLQSCFRMLVVVGCAFASVSCGVDVLAVVLLAGVKEYCQRLNSGEMYHLLAAILCGRSWDAIEDT